MLPWDSKQDPFFSPLAATVECELPSYEAAPKQSTSSIVAVLLRKHLTLGFRRRRFVGVIFRVASAVAVPLLIWFVQKPESREHARGSLAAGVLPILGVMLLIALFTQFSVEVVTDKELKMRYVQQVAGVSGLAYWLSHYLYYSVLTALASVLWIMSTMWFAPIYKYSDASLVFLALSAAFLQSFFVCMVVGTTCSRSHTAGVVCAIMGAVVVGAYYGLLPLVDTRSFGVYFAQSLIPFVSPLNLLGAIGTLERPDTSSPWGMDPPGFTWASFYAPVSAMNDQSGRVRMQPAAGDQLLILFLDCVLYGLFAVWFDEVHQCEFGVAKPLTFCLEPAWICPRRAGQRMRNAQAPALQLEDLVKTFGAQRAVDGMSLEVHRAEIFALLGHNGAGKTTAINCITGMLPITSGSARVCGVDVTSELHEARRHLSVCPQDNPLYPEHSAEEHLQFFAALRAVPASSAVAAIGDALEALGLAEKRCAQVGALSGGQKRRLWAATSLLGLTPVVFLDEPTSGMDPTSRRKLWDLLQRMNSLGRCVLFTTHYLDEADVLAERKAVLHQGRVQAVGTSMQLKRQFGLGYHLHVAGPPAAQAPVATLVRAHVPNAENEAQRSGAWSFALPYGDCAGGLGRLLGELEAKAPELQVADFWMETTTLEEVFMSLGEASGGTQGAKPAEHLALDLASPRELVPASWLTSLKAVVALRWQQALQKPRGLLVTLLAPAAVLFVEGWLLALQLGAIEDGASPAARVAQGSAGAGAGLWMSISLAIALPHFATALVQDRTQRCLDVACSQGLPLSAYWAGTLLSNFLHLLLLAAVVPVAVLAFRCPFFSEWGTLSQFTPSALVSPVPMLLFAYTASKAFPSAEACAKFMPSISLLAAGVPFLSVYVLTFLGLTLQLGSMAGQDAAFQAMFEQGKAMHRWANAIHWAMCFGDPFYLLPGTFAAIGLTQLTDFAVDSSGGSELDVLFPSIAGSCVAVPLLGALVLSLALAAALAWGSCASLRGLGRALGRGDQELERSPLAAEAAQDPDVLAEQQRVESADPAEFAVTYKGLAHTYNPGTRREVHAVRGISLAVSPGECFCLLGPNGAGKTTTLDALTGAILPMRGQVWIGGHCTAGSHEGCRLGNCPQVDPLWPTLTGRQHLLFYAKVKGLPVHLRESQAAALLRGLGFSEGDADKPTEGYSGGMRRKLSVALALIASPLTLLLDEPSAALDAGAKRQLWRVLQQRPPGQSVMLTTHSMEEAEALSDRIAIQVRGRLRCLGTPEHIKMAHGAGYQLELLTSDRSSAVAFVRGLWPSASLLECHEERCVFQLPLLRAVGARKGELSLAAVFLKLQEATQSLGLRDYSIARPSLEQVFLRLSREQESDEADG